MTFKSFWNQLNFVAQCRKYGLSLWQCPSFLFLILGAIVITAMVVTYYFATKYVLEPQLAALIVMLVATVLFIIGHFIVQSFDRLAAASRAKTEFISVASHQLRTPLTNIKWMLSVIMKEAEKSMNGQQLDELRIIKENNDRMNDLVNDLLVATRVDQGRLKMIPEETDLGQLVRGLVDEYQAYAQANNVSIQQDIKSNTTKISADPNQLRLAIKHLLDNSIRYIGGVGWVKVKVTEKGKVIRCEIEDSGVGIPKKEHVKVFSKFFRSQNVMRYQTQGTGLGLFIVKAIIKNSEGKIGFTSEEGKGTLFWFELPHVK